MSRITDEQRHRIVAAINDPNGMGDPIWAELGMAPCAPFTPEESALIARIRGGEPVPERWVVDDSPDGGRWVVGS